MHFTFNSACFGLLCSLVKSLTIRLKQLDLQACCFSDISSSGANNDPDPVMSVPNLMKMSCYSKVQQCSFEQQNVYSKSQESVQEVRK